MTIRDATPDDLPEIVAMIHELAVYEEAADEVTLDEGEVARHLFGPAPAI